MYNVYNVYVINSVYDIIYTVYNVYIDKCVQQLYTPSP